LIRFLIVLLSIGSSSSFATSNYSELIEKFAETTVFDKYKETFELTGEQKFVGDKIKKRTAVKVSCFDATPWDIYIRVKVQTLIPLIVSSRPLSKGEVLDDENTKLIYKAKSLVRGSTFSDAQSLRGVRLKRNVSSKKSIQHKDICYVCEGDKVTITANKTGLTIKASGIALTDGNIGSTVKVKNMRTQRIVIGTVYALKEVHVTF